MKFYFCQSCGVRVTEDDIADGAARDKKLKGVYCSSCAVGVSTMNAMPMSEREARTLLEDKKAAEPVHTADQSASRAGSRRSGQVSEPRGRGVQPSSGGSSRQLAGPVVSASKSWVWIAAGLVCVCALIVAVMILSSDRTAPANVKTKANRAGSPGLKELGNTQKPTAKTDDSSTAQPVSIVREEKRNPVAPEPDPVRPAEDSGESSQRIGSIAPDKPVGTVDPLKPETHSKPIESKEPPKPKKTEKPEPVFDEAYVKDVLAALRKGDWKASAEIAARPPENCLPELKASLVALASRRLQREKALIEALESKVGQDISVSTGKGKITGKLSGFQDSVLRIEKPFKIDGKIRGYATKRVALKDLAKSSIEALVPTNPPSSRDDWIRQVFWSVAMGAFEQARDGLARIPGHVLEKPLAAFVSRESVALRERQARAEWKGLAAKAETELSKKEAEQILAAIDAFEKRFGSTAFGSDKTHLARRKEIRDMVWRLTLGSGSRLLKLFHGKVVDYDPRTMRLTVEYDWSHKDQKKDFDGTNWGVLRNEGHHRSILRFAKGNILLQESKGGRDVLKMGRFLADGLQLTLHLGFRCFNRKTEEFNGYLAFRFSGPGNRAKSTPVEFRIGKHWRCKTGWVGLPGGPGMLPGFKSFPAKGVWEVTCRSQGFTARCNGELVSDVKREMETKHTGFTLRAGGGVGVDITRLRVTGRLAPAWSRDALKQAK